MTTNANGRLHRRQRHQGYFRAAGFVAAALAIFAVALATAHKAHAAAPAGARPAAIVIGNQTYARGVAQVPYALNDARAMARFARDEMGVAADDLLAVENADRATLFRLFGSSAQPGRVKDLVRPGVTDLVIYYSGHGVPGRTDGRAYLLPVDGDPANAEAGGYPLDLLYDNLARLGARSVTIYLDASFGGRSWGGPLVAKEPRIPPAVAPFDAPDGVAVMTAARPEQVAAWDKEDRHGLFTEYLLRALYGAADAWETGNGDGQVTLAEVKQYLDREMTAAARRDLGRTQNVDVTGVNDFVLARFDPANPPLRPLSEPRDVAQAVAKEVPLPEDKAPAVAQSPALTAEDVSPLPLPETKPLDVATLDPVPARPVTRSVAPAPQVARVAPAVDPETQLWNEVLSSDNPEYVKVYLLRYPDGRYVDAARVRFGRLLDDLRERRLREWRAQRAAVETEWAPPPPPPGPGSFYMRRDRREDWRPYRPWRSF